jgi:hypothetical protein
MEITSGGDVLHCVKCTSCWRARDRASGMALVDVEPLPAHTVIRYRNNQIRGTEAALTWLQHGAQESEVTQLRAVLSDSWVRSSAA